MNRLLYRLFLALGRRLDKANLADMRHVRNDWRSLSSDWDDYEMPYPAAEAARRRR
jgi:hypothetical protein